MDAPPASLRSLFASWFAHRDLCRRLTQREVTQRFRGSLLGLAWAVLTPLLTAAVLTLVFTGVFPQRWPGRSGAPLDFALILLVGMAVHGLMAEALSRAPTLIVGNPGYVTRVVFPLELLPLVTVLAASVNTLVTLGIVLLGNLLVNGSLHWTALFLPLVLLPYLVLVVAATALLAALGVFIRDIALVIAPVLTLLMFLSPMFYPLEAVPENWRFVIRANPMTPVMEQARTVLLFGGWPDVASLALYLALALGALAAAHWVFQRLRPGFADVV
ncbi:MAG: ABC transporter permease [Roseococcus sp.]|jgi:lipopolysaccharide transport system permease protein